MVQTRSVTRKEKYYGKRPWSDLNDDVLYLVMMRLGVVEFISFGGVCKSWRSVAVSNRRMFMRSRPPMAMGICDNRTCCHLQDYEGREFKTIIPELVGRKCVGLGCGYLFLFGEKTRDFLLVNPITLHQRHFPNVSFDVDQEIIRAILVFSPSINGWVFAMIHRLEKEIWFSIAGKGAWDHVSATNIVLDIHAFKGKIYTLSLCGLATRRNICELRLDDPVPKLTLLHTRFLEPVTRVFEFISSDESLYLSEFTSYKVHRLAFDQLTWMPCEKTIQECVLFDSNNKYSGAFNPESWSSQYQYGRFFNAYQCGKDRLYSAEMWYFPHDCLNGISSYV